MNKWLGSQKNATRQRPQRTIQPTHRKEVATPLGKRINNLSKGTQPTIATSIDPDGKLNLLSPFPLKEANSLKGDV